MKELTKEDYELLTTLVENEVYDCFFKHLFFKNKEGEWKQIPKNIVKERYYEHKEEYCTAMCLSEDEYKLCFRVVLDDVLNRKEKIGRICKFTNLDNKRREAEEINNIKESRRGMLNEHHKEVLDILGSYEAAMNSYSVKKWLEYDSGVTQTSIVEYYQSKI